MIPFAIHLVASSLIQTCTFPVCIPQECSVFLFEKRTAEKLHKPKRKESVTELLRTSVKRLDRYRHPKILQVIHPVEECQDTLAFATEPILASLANVLAFQVSKSGDQRFMTMAN